MASIQRRLALQLLSDIVERRVQREPEVPLDVAQSLVRAELVELRIILAERPCMRVIAFISYRSVAVTPTIVEAGFLHAHIV